MSLILLARRSLALNEPRLTGVLFEQLIRNRFNHFNVGSGKLLNERRTLLHHRLGLFFMRILLLDFLKLVCRHPSVPGGCLLTRRNQGVV